MPFVWSGNEDSELSGPTHGEGRFASIWMGMVSPSAAI